MERWMDGWVGGWTWPLRKTSEECLKLHNVHLLIRLSLCFWSLCSLCIWNVALCVWEWEVLQQYQGYGLELWFHAHAVITYKTTVSIPTAVITSNPNTCWGNVSFGSWSLGLRWIILFRPGRCWDIVFFEVYSCTLLHFLLFPVSFSDTGMPIYKYARQLF